jgi:enediyne core biosynthesis thioesterase
MRAYEYRHVVGFEETNLVGNVYYVHHLRWQGRCREMFLREHAPGVLQALSKDLALATVRCSCDYLRELNAFDEIIIRMRLASAHQHRLSMEFEYWRQTPAGEELVARGGQEIACMRRNGGQTLPTPVPPELQEALRAFSDTDLR